MHKLTDISENARDFTANGKKYIIESRLSLFRQIEYQKYELELITGLSGVELFNKLKQAFEYLQEPRIADCVLLLNQLTTSVGAMHRKDIPAYKICALFINEENEDRRTISEEQIKQKISDWNEAGIPADFFLRFAKTIVLGFVMSLEEDFPDTSPTPGEEKQSQDKSL